MADPSERWEPPTGAIRPWVDRIGSVRSAAPQRRDVLYTPSPEASLLVRWGHDEECAVSVIGPLRRARRKSFVSPARYTRIVLRAGYARVLLGEPMGALADRVVPIEELWGAPGARLRDALATSPARALDLLVTAITERTGQSVRSTPAADLLERAMRSLGTKQGRVARTAAELGVSDRHLRRLFHEELGMTPKHYARLVRLGRVLSPHRSSWTIAAQGAGFHDQSHLIREFHDLLQVTPVTYQRGLRSPG